MEQPLATLQQRYLRPQRARRLALHALVRRASSIESFLVALADAGHPPWPSGPRWFWLSRGQTRRHPVHRRFQAEGADASCSTSKWPVLANQAVAFASDPEGMVRAEVAARAFAEVMWPVLGRPGTPPTEVVWRWTAAAAAPGRTHIPWLLSDPPESWIRRGFDRFTPWSDPFGRVAIWTEALAHRGPEGALTAWVSLWSQGVGLWAMHRDHLALFWPATDDAAVWQKDVPSLNRPHPPRRVDSALLRACRFGGDPDEVRRLLRQGADPNARGLRTGGMPALRPLQGALVRPGGPQLDVIEALLDGGADPGRTDGEGANVWARALLTADPEPGLAALTEARVPTDVRDADGRTALHQLAEQDRPWLVAQLVERGLAVDALDDEGRTPLHVALRRRAFAAAQQLLQLGADPRRATDDGYTAHHFAATARDVPEALWSALGPEVLPAGPLSERPLVAVPDDIVPAVLANDAEAWAVLADWLGDHEDPRADAVQLALLRRAGRASRQAYRTAVSAARAAMLRPFAEVSPAGRRFVDEQSGRFQILDGLLHRLVVPADYVGDLAELLDHPGAQLLGYVAIRSRSTTEVTWPTRCRVPHVQWWVEGSAADLVFPGDRFVDLATLELRVGAGTGVTVSHPGLRRLSIEQPRDDQAELARPTLDLPSLERLAWRGPRAVLATDDAHAWWSALLADPPSGLRVLQIGPTTSDRIVELLDSRLWRQLNRVVWTDLDAAFEGWLRSQTPTIRLAFRHLERLEFRAARGPLVSALQFWAQQHEDVLPAVDVRHAASRAPGQF